MLGRHFCAQYVGNGRFVSGSKFPVFPMDFPRSIRVQIDPKDLTVIRGEKREELFKMFIFAMPLVFSSTCHAPFRQ